MKPAFVFDLDGIINHANSFKSALCVFGRTKNSFIDPCVLKKLSTISTKIALFVATGRAVSTIKDFERYFNSYDVNISGWILEHGAFVKEYPQWTDKVTENIDLALIHQQIKKVVAVRGFSIDTEIYRKDHKGFLLYSGNGIIQAEHFLTSIASILGNNFRTIVGKRKIAIIPILADKYIAFNKNFGSRYFIAFAAGDMPDDLTLLQNAKYPLTISNGSNIVKKYVQNLGGYVTENSDHAGINELLNKIIYKINNKELDNFSDNFLHNVRLPYEEINTFRPSRVTYLEKLFSYSVYPKAIPNIAFLKELGLRLDSGKKIIIEVKMRDWGGEVKVLLSMVKAILPFLPFAKWRLIFRRERLCVENLKNFNSITSRLKGYCKLPNESNRFSAPGVPDSPSINGKSDIILLMFDHPEDLAPYYDLAMTKLITRHPDNDLTWFVNPMFLKIFNNAEFDTLHQKSFSNFIGLNTMMAANIVDEIDIQIAIDGFKKLFGIIDSLIIAPRVITNKNRNKMIKEAVLSTNKFFCYLSEINNFDKPSIVIVDSYGDLDKLYNGCRISYIGGGFNSRKRGFDPMESIVANAPVIMGPIYDFNRIAVDSLKKTNWINILEKKETALSDFVCFAKKNLSSKPNIEILNILFNERKDDPLRVASEIIADLTGETKNGYLYHENNFSPLDMKKLVV